MADSAPKGWLGDWRLCAAWLVALVAGASGRSKTMTLGPSTALVKPSPAPAEAAAANPPKPKCLPDSTIDDNPAETPVINVFGLGRVGSGSFCRRWRRLYKGGGRS